jgi:hypothetical protein
MVVAVAQGFERVSSSVFVGRNAQEAALDCSRSYDIQMTPFESYNKDAPSAAQIRRSQHPRISLNSFQPREPRTTAFLRAQLSVNRQ